MSDEEGAPEGAEDASIHISIETREGRTNLKGESVEGTQPSDTGGDAPSGPDGRTPAPADGASPSADMDADTMAIDSEMAMATYIRFFRSV